MTRRNKYLAIVFFIFFLNALSSQSIDVSVSSDTILIGNYIELTVTINNIDGEFSEPFVEGAEIMSGPNVSSSIQIINGDKNSTMSYSYYIKPTELGYVNIGPASIKDDDIILKTEPLELITVPNPENLIINPQKKSQEFFFDLNDNWPFSNRKKQEPLPSKRKLKRI